MTKVIGVKRRAQERIKQVLWDRHFEVSYGEPAEGELKDRHVLLGRVDWSEYRFSSIGNMRRTERFTIRCYLGFVVPGGDSLEAEINSMEAFEIIAAYFKGNPTLDNLADTVEVELVSSQPASAGLDRMGNVIEFNINCMARI
jgi:hypothetical protein